MDGGSYLTGAAAVATAAAALAHGGGAVRRAALPGWGGARGVLAQTVVAVALGVAVARLLGAVGLLTGPAVLAGEVGAGLAVGALARRSAPVIGSGGTPPDPITGSEGAGRRRPWWEWVLGVGPVVVVVLQWAAHAGDAYGRGMVHPDTLWYHGPFAARFAQSGHLGTLDGVGYEAARWFPLDGQLVHGLGILAVDGDGLSPLVNLGWLALALLAAWCLGERRGAGPTALATASVVLGAPFLAATQPGQMSTDIGCAALLLAAVALVLESDLRPAPLAVAGTAAGLAVGTKVTLVVPVAVLVLAVAVAAYARRGGRPAAWWLAPAGVTGAFWFGRNWVLSGSPLPWFTVPGLFDRVTIEGQGDSLLVAGRLDRDAWRAIYRPGLEQALGAGWPWVLALAGVGATLVVRRGRPTPERVAGLVVLAGLAGHVATPLTAGISFGFNLRYLAPTLLLGAALAPLAVRPGVAGRVALGGGAAVLVGVGAAAPHVERVTAWPDATPAAAAVLAVGALVALAAVAARRRVRPGVVPAALTVVAVVAGWPLAAALDEGRYVDADLPPTDAIPAAVRDVRGARVALYGSVETYPLFGTDLSNRVEVGTPPPGGPGSPCTRWRDHLADRYDVVVVSRWGFMPLAVPPPEVFAGAPGVHRIAGRGDRAVYRLDTPLDPAHCPV